jgi:hypothetical protein
LAAPSVLAVGVERTQNLAAPSVLAVGVERTQNLAAPSVLDKLNIHFQLES